MRFRLTLALVFTLALFGGVAAQANPMTWTLENVTFGSCWSWGGSAPDPGFPCDSGGTASGSFVFDATAQTFSAWNISVDGGDEGVFPQYTWSDVSLGHSVQLIDDASYGPNVILSFSGDVSPEWGFVRQIRLLTADVLPDAYSTTVPLVFDQSYAVECYNCIPYRFLVTGQLTSSAPSSVPEPTSLLLVCAGLAALGAWPGRRR